ncbi:MAG: SDR family oxidoreductase [Cephaloticoccus sp.]|nr:SDR family oxidoreductase [Cephaloticoccus sp.]MCF7761466.1 SDR family oxidoreductase [Cephaloticoccus sp.]
MPFTDQVIWITGASSGIGEGLVHALDLAGARLVLSSRNVSALERVRAACTRPEAHRVVPLDLARAATFPAAVQQVLSHFGRIDILVNNGGISQRALAVEATKASERALMEVDYFGPVALTKAVLPAMRARQAGRVVVISSVMGYVGTPGRSSYAAAKHALHGYFDSLRAELWREKIKVTLVCPGYVQTAVSANAINANGEKYGRTDLTHQRGIPVERCVRAILRGIARDREEIAVGGFEVLGIYLKRFLPWLYSRVVRRMKFSTR